MNELDWIKFGYFAHRGLHNESYPENTISAFEHAVRNGFDIEFDVRITKDNKLVVVHDNKLKRLCNSDKKVHSSTFAEIKELKILGSDQTIMLLEDVLSQIPNTTSLLIELKQSNKNKKMVKIFLDTIKNYQHRYAIHSFDPFILFWFKKMDKSIIRGQISKKYSNKHILHGYLLTNLFFNFLVQPHFINYKFKDLPNKLCDRQKNKRLVLSYTARNEEELLFIRDRYDNAVFEGFIPKK